ncbi:hypothetical protein HAP54_000032290 [Bradyrhizobium sp. 2S1]|nr:hypothetical protein [Bradyrhizobium sp. 2S1]MCK7670924.1 hypothetical protein [Bradyrhizobium sp. 2S1]
MSVTGRKQYDIDKQTVMKAYRLVKANAGSAGVDKVSLEAFEKDLKGNLYKVWNRMSSGSYFPPAVRAVSIPKKNGGQRILEHFPITLRRNQPRRDNFGIPRVRSA